MDPASWLRDRILRTLALPAIATLGSCATSAPAAEQPGSVEANAAQRDSLCKTWLAGRDYTWCTDIGAAKELAGNRSPQSLGCPSVLDQAKVRKALEARKIEKGNPRRTDVILLHEKSKTASNDCQQNVCCYVWANRGQGNSRRHLVPGRPLSNDDRFSFADAVSAQSWTKTGFLPDLGLALSTEERATVAAHWLASALAEHASVASFSRASIELMAVGAPIELVRGTAEGASDEIDHAMRCFSVAEAYGSRVASPGPLPTLKPRPATLEDVARYTFLEGCVHETIASLEAVLLSTMVGSPHLRDILRTIASDEVRHAELAWKILAWCHRKSPETVSQTIRAAIPGIRATSQRRTVQPTGLVAHGILDTVQLDNVTARAWSTVIDPALATLRLV